MMMVQADWAFPLSQGLLWNGGALGPVHVEARAFDEDRVPIATSAMSTAFVRGETRLVTLDLSAACAGYACEEICVAGRCVSDFERETPEFDGDAFPALDRCDGADNDDDGGTDEDADRTSQATCGEACVRCEESVCSGGTCVAGVVEAVSASTGSVCAVHTSGLVTCWGDNELGELGRTAAADGSEQRAQPKAVIRLPAVRVGGLSAGARHFCAATDLTDEVYCWGANDHGQLGPNTARSESSAPVSTGVLALDVDAGGSHTCAVDLDGVVKCWGANFGGQLDESMTDSSEPRLAGITGASAVAAGMAHSCAIVGGDVRCWGSNDFEQVGGGPTAVVVSDAYAIEAGTFHTCAIVGADRHVVCWGLNEGGALGTDDMSVTFATLSIADVVELSSSPRTEGDDGIPSHTCARTSDGAVHCWGMNDGMQVGAGVSTSPQRIDRLGGVVQSVAAGGSHTSVVIANAVWTWGSNRTGQWGTWSMYPPEDGRMQASDRPVLAVLP